MVYTVTDDYPCDESHDCSGDSCGLLLGRDGQNGRRLKADIMPEARRDGVSNLLRPADSDVNHRFRASNF